MARIDRCWVLGGFVLAGLLALPVTTRAQSFAFGISSGGGGHHHCHGGGGWWAGYGVGPYWGPRWYGPPAVVYAAPPVVQERVIYVQPQPQPPPVVLPANPYSSTSSSAGSASFASNPMPASSAAEDRIVVRNTAGVSLPVTFVVDGQEIELADGSTRTFVGKGSRTIQYDRGGRFGSTQQELSGGQYEFRVTTSGWDLVRKPDGFTSRTAVKANSLPEAAVSR